MIKRLMMRMEGEVHKLVGFPRVILGDKQSKKRALLINLAVGMKWKENEPRLHWHHNVRRCRYMASSLVKRGFCVEVVQHDDARFKPTGAYDLIIAHTGIVMERLRKEEKTGMWIYLRTGKSVDFVERQIPERYALLDERGRKGLSWSGSKGSGQTSMIYKGFDAIVCPDGNGTTADSYVDTDLPVYTFRNFASPAMRFIKKDSSNVRNGFVYMSAHMPVSKGLDWLIEVFVERPDLNLYVCGNIPADFKEIYHEEFLRPNIHELGFIDTTSNDFKSLCRKADWYISPSATESCQGAALNTMASGLVPILSEACGVDTCGVGLKIEPCTIEELRKVVGQAVKMPSEVIEKQGRLAREIVEQRYQPQHFEEDWEHILEQIGV